MADPKLDAWGPEAQITNVSVGANNTYIKTETVRTNLTNGQLWGIDPIPTNATSGYEPLWDSDETDYSAPLRSEPLWDSGDGSAPLRTEALWDSDETDASAPLRDEPLWDSDGTAWRPVDDLYSDSQWGSEPIAEGQSTSSALSGQGGLKTSETQSPSSTPSTRPYIWKYK